MLKNLLDLRSEFEIKLKEHVECLNITKELLDPLKHVLLNSGKRIRPLLVLLIAEAIGKGQNVYPAAFCTEFFHTASLIADDLPCMDDDDFRRGEPSLHKAYDEQTALLISYGLISQAFQEIHNNFLCMPTTDESSLRRANKVLSLTLSHACKFSGFKGAVCGQYFDLKSNGKALSESLKINEGKTGALFIGTFVLGFAFGGGDLALLEKVEQAAEHFGAAFQIYDDVKDVSSDRKKMNLANVALILGKKQAKQECRVHLNAFFKITREIFKDPSLLDEAVKYCFKSIL